MKQNVLTVFAYLFKATIAVELLEQVPDLEAIVVPVGGGGLSAGIALATKLSKPNTKGKQKYLQRAVRQKLIEYVSKLKVTFQRTFLRFANKQLALLMWPSQNDDKQKKKNLQKEKLNLLHVNHYSDSFGLVRF